MATLRQYALEAWGLEQESRKQAERKKRKRKAKKIEDEIEDLLPKAADELQFERDLENGSYEVVVTVVDSEGTMRFAQVDGALVLLGICSGCRKECPSSPIRDASGLGELLEHFRPVDDHACS
ncbi:MAG TPA: hypothetical protein VKM94_22360 [Blastocatellia bacterium]|nr:hypothetical protein [Blastocatellia bacterium]